MTEAILTRNLAEDWISTKHNRINIWQDSAIAGWTASAAKRQAATEQDTLAEWEHYHFKTPPTSRQYQLNKWISRNKHKWKWKRVPATTLQLRIYTRRYITYLQICNYNILMYRLSWMLNCVEVVLLDNQLNLSILHPLSMYRLSCRAVLYCIMLSPRALLHICNCYFIQTNRSSIHPSNQPANQPSIAIFTHSLSLISFIFTMRERRQHRNFRMNEYRLITSWLTATVICNMPQNYYYIWFMCSFASHMMYEGI